MRLCFLRKKSEKENFPPGVDLPTILPFDSEPDWNFVDWPNRPSSTSSSTLSTSTSSSTPSASFSLLTTYSPLPLSHHPSPPTPTSLRRSKTTITYSGHTVLLSIRRKSSSASSPRPKRIRRVKKKFGTGEDTDEEDEAEFGLVREIARIQELQRTRSIGGGVMREEKAWGREKRIRSALRVVNPDLVQEVQPRLCQSECHERALIYDEFDTSSRPAVQWAMDY